MSISSSGGRRLCEERSKSRAGPAGSKEDAMRVFVMHKVNADIEAGRKPSPELIAKIHETLGVVMKEGRFLAGEGLHGTSSRVRVDFANGQPSVEKGPLVGAKEAIAGLTTIQVGTVDEAVGWAKRYGAFFPEGEVVVGPVVEGWDLGFMPKPENPPLRAMLTHKNGSGVEHDPTPSESAGLAALHDEMKKAGVYLNSFGLEPSKSGKRLKLDHKKRTVIDGPFAEAKELIAGFSLMEVDSVQQAIDFSWPFAEVLGEDTEIDVRVAADQGR
jgi:hypothetical protein